MHTIHFSRSVMGLAVALACDMASAQVTSTQGNDLKMPQMVVVAPSADASAAGLPAAYPGGQVARGGRVGILGNVDNMNSPFSSTIYTQALIQDKQAKSIADVLLNDPTVRVARGFGNYQELYVIRGFPVNSDDLGYNGLYGLLPRQVVAAELIERVEVMRGATAFLNGSSPGGGGIGGAINLLPKRAPNAPLTQITAGVDSGGQGYVAADVARRFGPDQNTGVRVNVVRRDGDTAIDDEKRKLSVVSVGVDYRGRDLRLSADVGFQDHDLQQARPSVTLVPGIAVPVAPNASANFSQPWSFSKERNVFGSARGELDLAPDVTAWIAGGARRGNESNVLANPTVINAAGDTSTYRFDNTRKDTVVTGEVGLRAKLRAGSVTHDLSASVSAFQLDSHNAYALSNFAGFGSNLYAPTAVASPAANFFTGGALNDPLLTQKTTLSSVALADMMTFADDRVLLTLGARLQSIKDKSYDYTSGALNEAYDKRMVTPVAGLVFKMSKNLSVYANYIEALNRGPVAGGTASNVGEVFAPYRSKQKEIGVKYDAGKFGMNLALYTTSQPQEILDVATNRFGVDGEQRNRGAELTVYGMPMRGVRLLGGLTFTDAKQQRTAAGLNDGRDVIGVPDFQANLGADWDVPGVSGLSVSGRAIYTASQFADAANRQEVSAWTRFDAGLRYATSIGKQAVTIRGQIENLANRNYWASAGGYQGAGYLVLGAPRTLVLSASLDF